MASAHPAVLTLRRRLARSRPARMAMPVMLAAVLLAVLPAAAQARPGVYLALGAGQQSVTGGLDGDRTVTGPPNQELRLGKLENGTGLTLNGGFGFNDYVALEVLYSLSRHDAHYALTNADTTATVNTAVLGVRAGLPLGDVAEVFGRAGLGGYEVTYHDANVRISDGQVLDDARLSGLGLAAGVGAELFFGKWAVQLAYTVHDTRLSGLDSLNFGTELSPAEHLTLATASVLVTYYLE